MSKDLAEAIFRKIAPEVMHACWCCYQMGAGQKYNVKMLKSQQKSLENAVDLYLKFPNATPQERHNNWMDYKLANGWKYGKVKNIKKKTHPDLAPWGKLPQVEKNKDIMNRLAGQVSLSISKQLAEAVMKGVRNVKV